MYFTHSGPAVRYAVHSILQKYFTVVYDVARFVAVKYLIWVWAGDEGSSGSETSIVS